MDKRIGRRWRRRTWLGDLEEVSTTSRCFSLSSQIDSKRTPRLICFWTSVAHAFWRKQELHPRRSCSHLPTTKLLGEEVTNRETTLTAADKKI